MDTRIFSDQTPTGNRDVLQKPIKADRVPHVTFDEGTVIGTDGDAGDENHKARGEYGTDVILRDSEAVLESGALELPTIYDRRIVVACACLIIMPCEIRVYCA